MARASTFGRRDELLRRRVVGRGRFAAAGVIAAVAAGTLAGEARATTLYWDINGAAADTATPLTGNWDGSTADWNTDPTGGGGGTTTATTTSSDGLVFSSGSAWTGGTVTLSASRFSGSITFSLNVATSLTAGDLTLGGVGVMSGIFLTSAMNNAVNILSPLTISTAVSAINISSAANTNGTLTLSGTNALTGSASTSNVDTVDIGSTSNGSIIISGIISDGTGGGKTALVVSNAGSGTTTLSGANKFTGGLTIKSGTAIAGVSNVSTTSGAAGPSAAAITLGDPAGGSASLLSNGFTVANAINLAPGAVGTLTIGNVGGMAGGTFSGAIALNGDNLSIVASGTSAAVNFYGGITGTGNVIIDYNETSGSGITFINTINNVGTITNSGTGTAAGQVNISANIGSNVTSLIQNSATSYLQLTASNTFAGTINIAAGVLLVSSSADDPNVTGITLANGATLKLDYNGTATALGSGTLTINGGTISKIGGSTVTYTPSALNVNNSFTLDGTSPLCFSGAVTLSQSVTITATATVSASSFFSGSLNQSGAGGYTLSKAGPGILIFSDNSTPGGNFAGNVVISAGTLQVSGSHVLNSANGVTVAAGTTFNFANNVIIAGLDDGVGGPGSTTAIAAGTVLNFAGSGNHSYSGVISTGAGATLAVTRSGTGTQVLGGANTYAGGTDVTGGVLLVTNTTGSATGSNTVTLDGGTLGGSGSISGAVVAGSAAHTIAPSFGLSATSTTNLSVGSLTTNSNTTLAFNLNGGGVSDRITAGNLTLNGGTLAVANTQTGAPSLGYYKLIAYSGSILGTGLSSLAVPTSPAGPNVVYTLDLNHDAGFVDLHRGFLGDANDDGVVNFSDFVALSNHFGLMGAGWSGGDFNGDGIVNFSDFVILSNNFGNTIPGSSETVSASDIAGFDAAASSFFGTSSVPEPTSLALMGLGAAMLLRRRRKA